MFLLAGGEPLAMHGVQITPTALVRPANVPPFGSWFVDFDGYFEDPEVEVHVGDVEVLHPCEGRAGYYEQIPGGGYLPPFYPPDFPPPVARLPSKSNGFHDSRIRRATAYLTNHSHHKTPPEQSGGVLVPTSDAIAPGTNRLPLFGIMV